MYKSTLVDVFKKNGFTIPYVKWLFKGWLYMSLQLESKLVQVNFF